MKFIKTFHKYLAAISIAVFLAINTSQTVGATTEIDHSFNLQISPIICILESIEVGTNDIHGIVPDLCQNLPIFCELETVDIGVSSPDQVIFMRCRAIISPGPTDPDDPAASTDIDTSETLIIGSSIEEIMAKAKIILQERDQLAEKIDSSEQRHILRVDKAIATITAAIVGIYIIDLVFLDLLITQRFWFLLSRLFG